MSISDAVVWTVRLHTYIISFHSHNNGESHNKYYYFIDEEMEV
jgi:hypothetical protein